MTHIEAGKDNSDEKNKTSEVCLQLAELLSNGLTMKATIANLHRVK
jgi:hypothetical protein